MMSDIATESDYFTIQEYWHGVVYIWKMGSAGRVRIVSNEDIPLIDVIA